MVVGGGGLLCSWFGDQEVSPSSFFRVHAIKVPEIIKTSLLWCWLLIFEIYKEVRTDSAGCRCPFFCLLGFTFFRVMYNFDIHHQAF